jgi:hypothetical protein
MKSFLICELLRVSHGSRLGAWLRVSYTGARTTENKRQDYQNKSLRHPSDMGQLSA